MRALAKAILLFVFIVSSVSAQRNYSFSWHEETIQIDGTTRHFTFFIPRACPENAPVVFVFHSGNSGMEDVFNTGDGFNEWPNLSEREKFILVVPNGVNPITKDTDGSNQKWNDCRKDVGDEEELAEVDDVLFVSKLIDWSKRNLAIDENRIYVTGIDNGGMMVYRLALELGDQIAAAAVFFASMPSDSECGIPVRPIPMFIMNSMNDPYVPFEGGTISGERGKVMSAEETLNYWVSLNLLNTQKRTNKFYEDLNPDDNSRVVKNEFDRPFENPHVDFYVITNAGHVVPSIKYGLSDSQKLKQLGNQNRDIEGVVEAWKFLRNSTLR